MGRYDPERGERWIRVCMGMRHSPYACTQGLHRIEEVDSGNYWDTTNHFNWIKIPSLKKIPVKVFKSLRCNIKIYIKLQCLREKNIMFK